MIEGVGYGWVEVIIIAHGPGWSLLAWLFSFPVSSEFGCIYIDVQGPYTTCMLSSIFYICNVDGMYFKIQMRVPCRLQLI